MELNVSSAFLPVPVSTALMELAQPRGLKSWSHALLRKLRVASPLLRGGNVNTLFSMFFGIFHKDFLL